jgi:hypothetical protein
MKIRQGFVSNSSSSSFLIYGVSVEDNDKLVEALKLTDEEKEGWEDEGNWFLTELFDDKDDSNLELQTAYDGEYLYLGRSWSSVGDNETGLEFKNSIQKDINKLLGENDDSKCSTISEAWMG